MPSAQPVNLVARIVSGAAVARLSHCSWATTRGSSGGGPLGRGGISALLKADVFGAGRRSLRGTAGGGNEIRLQRVVFSSDPRIADLAAIIARSQRQTAS